MNKSDSIEIVVLGSGTSAGVPMIGCHCRVCISTDPRDKRNRCSVAVGYAGRRVLIDTPPELRLAVIANQIDMVDAVILTHGHADHIFGLDDVRRYNTLSGQGMPILAGAKTLSVVRQAFPYAIDQAAADPLVYRPQILLQEITGTFELFGRIWTPIYLPHGNVQVLGFRVGDFAYCTDCSDIPPQERKKLLNLDVLIIDALRPTFHPTHLSFEQALAVIDDLKPRRAYFTHLTHDVPHAEIEQQLPSHVRVLYDGLRITLPHKGG
jgi:phosphoribosyl 1,2-cyclic phosphate phosphodiesterase